MNHTTSPYDETTTAEELAEAWINGNRSDVLDHLEASHPCVTALLIITLCAYQKWPDAQDITDSLITRKIESNEQN